MPMPNPLIAKLSERLINSLELLRSGLLSGLPRVLSCKMLETFFIFTDASFSKKDGGGFGAFLATQDGSFISWFGLYVGTERFATLTRLQIL